MSRNPGLLRYHQYWSDIIVFIEKCLSCFRSNRCEDVAAALTLATLFALVPSLAVLYSILAMIPELQGLGERIQALAFEHLVPSAGSEVQRYLLVFAEQARRLTVVGVVVLFVTALSMLRRIERAFNRIWFVETPRKGVVSFLRYWAVLSLGPLLLGFGLVMTSYVTSITLFSDALELIGFKKWG